MTTTVEARPRTWTPQIVAFSLLLHVAVLYYVAVAFQVVPPIMQPDNDPPVVEAVRFDPPPPPVIEELVKVEPRVRPRQPLPSPVAPPVDPIRLPPQPPAESTANAGTMVLNQPIQEQPIVQGLPRYPRAAERLQIEGKVRLSITIMPDGSVRDVRVIGAKPAGYFEAEALRAVQAWRYKPSNVIRQNVIVDIDFVLT
jgi:TonB family protein